MAEQENIFEIRELFDAYVAHLDQEFHDHASAKAATNECMTIATELLERGFVILIQAKRSVKTIQPTDDTVQTIITFEYDIALVKHEIPMQVPIAVACATTRIYGPTTIPIGHEHIQSAISPRDEKWLRDILDSMKSQLLSAWSTEPKNKHNQGET